MAVTFGSWLVFLVAEVSLSAKMSPGPSLTDVQLAPNSGFSLRSETEFVQPSAVDPLDFFANLPPIPKLVHLTWKNKDVLNSDLRIVLNGARNLVDLNPDWTVSVSNDTEVEAYLRDKLSAADYALIKDRHIVEKSDLWRLLKVYYEGGYYQDLDRCVNIPFSDIGVGNISSEVKAWLPIYYDYNFAQDVLLSASGSPLLKAAIDENLLRRRRGVTNIIEMGPRSYMFAVMKFLTGVGVDASNKVDFQAVRQQIDRSRFVKTVAEGGDGNSLLCRRDRIKRAGRLGGKRALYDDDHVKYYLNKTLKDGGW